MVMSPHTIPHVSAQHTLTTRLGRQGRAENKQEEEEEGERERGREIERERERSALADEKG
jgi:hypothetical protein